jgi:ABC-type transport system substrate-binding protein
VILKIRILLFIVPLFFLILLMTSLIFEAYQPHPRVNQLIISSTGDASFLNPILAQDAASSDINSFVFNGLIKYNQTLDGFVGELAESWKLKDGPEPERSPSSCAKESFGMMERSLRPMM